MRCTIAIGAVSVAWLATACGAQIVEDNTPVVAQSLVEQCDNNVDDDDDGQVDCQDADCTSMPACSASTGTSAIVGSPVFEVCHTSVGDRSQYPVDLIWAVDSSTSMDNELRWLGDQLNEFANRLIAQRADIRMILIGGEDLCVEPPLGGAKCADSERFMHIAKRVGNDEPLTAVLKYFDDEAVEYGSFLRPDAKHAIIAVSDDNPSASVVTAASFDEAVRKLGDGIFSSYVLHSIVAYSDLNPYVKGCGTGTSDGKTYLALSELTGGLTFPICDPNWTDIFSELGSAVAGLVGVPCSYPRTVIGTGDLNTDPNFLQVEAEVDGAWQVLTQLPAISECTASGSGWYADGDTINLCPTVCKASGISSVRVYHGCQVAAPE